MARDLREIISSEAGFNDGFGFPFLMLATYLMRHANGSGGSGSHGSHAATLVERAGDVGRQGGGVGKALSQWIVQTWLYYVAMGAVYGAIVGYISLYALRSVMRRWPQHLELDFSTLSLLTINRKWIDSESYLLFPTALGVSFI